MKKVQELSLNELKQEIVFLREQKGKSKEALALIDEASKEYTDFLITLLFEKALKFQHLVMENPKNKKPLQEAKKVIEMAEVLIINLGLKQWNSRLNRFKGRLSDYQNKHIEALKFYSQALKEVKFDPDYKKGLSIELELKAFIAFSTIKIGKIKEGLKQSQSLYESFEKDAVGKALKKLDYATWAIWRTGIAIRTINALIDVKSKLLTVDEMKAWLNEASELLTNSEAKSSPINFSYRKDDIKEVLKRLSK